MKFKYQDLYKRNIGILTSGEQERIKKTKVVILGCGGGSEIARQMVRSGFINFILADYDTVSLHNLNRQFYFQKDIGKNKAKTLDENLRLINPEISTDVWTDAVTTENVADAVKKSDLIIDAIPPETALKEEIILAREVRKSDSKHHLYFMDIVWGAKAIVFTKNSQTFEEFIGLEPDCNLSEVDKLTLEDLTKPYMENASSEMVRVGKMMYNHELEYFPQMAVTVSLAASVVTTLSIFLTIGRKVKLAPHIYHIDYFKDLINE
jgi:molybdopterin/thiamine biosynthesis adenylyltransferase